MPVDAELDLDRLAAAFSRRTRAIIVCTPNNPTGRVLTRRELEAIAGLCRRHDAYAVTDEIYEHIYYDGEHIPIATLDGMRDRTIRISGASKTFSVTGWRVGTIVAPPATSDAIRKVHDFLTVGAPAPLQQAIAVGLETLGDDYYATLAREYRARRDLLCRALVDAGFRCTPPQGAYYVLADFSGISPLPDDEFSVWLTREIGVSPVPGSSFFSRPELGPRLVRFAFRQPAALLEAHARRRALPVEKRQLFAPVEQLRPQRVGQVAVPEARPHQAPHARQHHGDRRRHDGEGARDHRHARLRIAHVEEPQHQERERDGRERAIQNTGSRELARLGDERPDGDCRAPLESRDNRGGEGFAAGVARVGILGETAVDRLGQAVRDSRGERGHRRRRIRDVAGERRERVRPPA